MLLHESLCYLAALSSAVIHIQTVAETLAIFVSKQSKMSISEASYGMLYFMLAEVLAKDIWLEVVIQDS